jgi:carboxypeptidase Q
MKRLILLLILIFILPALGQQLKIDQNVIAHLKEEALQHSQVMELTSYLSDIYGPRLAGTPEYFEAAQWAGEQLKKWGLKNITLERLDTLQRGWKMESISIEMIEPRYMPITGYPRAGCRSTEGEIIGKPVIVGDIFQEDSLRKYQGIMRGRIVLVDPRKKIQPSFQPFSHRWSDEELQQAENSLSPFPEKTLNEWEASSPMRDRIPSWAADEQKDLQLQKLLLEVGPAVLIEPSTLPHGMVRVDELYFGRDQTIEPVPSLVIANEQFYRLIRMMEKGATPVLKINVQTKFINNPEYQVNVLGEIPGRDSKLRSELVLIGGHLDSWQAATGATDNAVNCAILMEVMRIFQKLNLPTRRTVRIALWNGEELGYHGSRDYVEKHIGNIYTGEVKPEQTQLSVYLNLDNGAGKIRGIFLQGNEAAGPIFAALLQPFQNWGATTLTIQSTTYTDHEVFDVLNVPAFQFIQDPLNYMTVTHHSNMDTYDYLIEDDIKQNVVIVASLVYHLATMDEKVPRKEQ